MKKVSMIINPVAGKMRVKNTLFDIVQKFSLADYKVTMYITKVRGDATEIVRNIKREECDILVCAGGDGTLNEIISGVISSGENIPIGYIPCGSTNDFAQSMKLSTNILSAVDNIIGGTPSPIDIGVFGDNRYFSYIASFGAFTETSYNTPQQMKNVLGHLAYVIESVKSVANIKPYKIQVTADGKVYSGEYVFGAVSNSTSIGGVLKLGDDIVDVSDGKFEVVLAKLPTNPTELNELIASVVTVNLSSPMLTYFKASSLEIKCEEELDWTLDGEFEKGSGIVSIKNLNKKIQLVK